MIKFESSDPTPYVFALTSHKRHPGQSRERKVGSWPWKFSTSPTDAITNLFKVWLIIMISENDAMTKTFFSSYVWML